MMRRATYACLLALALGACGSDAPRVEPKAVSKRAQSLIMAPGWVAGSGWPAPTVVALSSFLFETNSQVKGDAVTITASAGPWLGDNSEAVIGAGAELRGNLKADTLSIRDAGHVFGTAAYNGVTSTGAIDGAVTPTLALPLAITVPTVPNFSAGTTVVDVAAGTTQTLAAGSYGTVTLHAGTLAARTVLRLSGGVYNVQSVDQQDHTRVECTAACEIRIKGRLSPGARTYLGPAGTSGLQMSAVQVFVEGQNASSAPDSSPAAAEVGTDAELKAFIFVPNGTLYLKAGSESVGKFLAKDVRIGPSSEVVDGTSIVALPDAWATGLRWPSEVVTAFNSASTTTASPFTGNVAVITSSPGPMLVTGFELSLGTSAKITGNARADTVKIGTSGQVTGSLAFNSLTNTGLAPGSSITPLALPLDLSVPAFPAFTAGTQTVSLGAAVQQTLAAGSYGTVTLGTSAVLTLSGGVYAMSDLTVGTSARLECSAACEIRVKNRVTTSSGSFIQPAGSLDLANVVMYVEGKNGGTGVPTATPASVTIGSGTVQALVFAPNGTLSLGTSVVARGHFVARDVLVNTSGSVQQSGVLVAPPVIKTQPQSLSVVEGSSATFRVIAVGYAATYQWQKNNVNIAGATTATFTIAATALADSGASYRAIVSNAGGSVTSSAATLTVTPLPLTFTTQPASVTVTEGNSASFTCVGSGSPVSYQWKKGGVAISGATNSTFTIASVANTDAGSYTCVATRGAQTATSNPATLTVNLRPPTITTAPASQHVLEGLPVTLHCLGSGTLIDYQWRKGGTDIAGATQQDFTIAAAAADDSGSYSCAIHNTGGTVVTPAAVLTVDLKPPVITDPPASTSLTEGQGFTLSCGASGTSVSYHWRKDDSDLPGATSATYSVSSAQLSDSGTYVCVASNSGGTIESASVTVTVKPPAPEITTQPADLNLSVGDPISLTVVASGAQLSYQWRRDAVAISGAIAATYSKAHAELSDDGAVFEVVVSNPGGSVTSRSATVHVSDADPPVLVVDNPASSTQTASFVTVTGTATDSGSGVSAVVVTSDRFAGQEFGAVLGAANTFSAEIPVALGANTLTIIARDAANNAAQRVIAVTVQPAQPPVITITEPSDDSTVASATVDVRGIVRTSLPASSFTIALGSDQQTASGSGPDYSFAFSGVHLLEGANLLTVVVSSPFGVVSKDVHVTYTPPPPPNTIPPDITLTTTQAEVYIVGDSIAVSGTATAHDACVQSVTVNGSPAHVTGSGVSVSFDATLSFAQQGHDDVTVLVVARDCGGLTSSRSYQAHKDDGPPQLVLNGLQLAPAVNTLLTTPYRLTGTISERFLAGLTVANQSVGVLPAGSPGQWTFSVDVPLLRLVDLPITVETWDLAGQYTTKQVILRLGTSFQLELLAPLNGTTFIVSGDTFPLEVTARAIGMAASDRVLVRFDGSTPVELARGGDTAHSTINVPAIGGAHTVSVSVLDSAGATLATQTGSIVFIDSDLIPLSVVRQTPDNEQDLVEANSPITLFFNKPIDPTKLTMSVLETVHGKLFQGPPDGADLLSLSNIELVDVDREREPVPGQAQNLPGNQMAVFYPSRDYGYGATVFVDLNYDGAPLYHSRFQVRPLPALVHGFVADHLWVPIEGIDVLIPELGVSATTNADGNFNFNFGVAADKVVPPGRYRAIINPGNKHQGFGSLERFISFDPGLSYLGVNAIEAMSSAEPYRHVVSGASTPAMLASGQLQLDLSHASLTFADGRAEGDVHVQLLSSQAISYKAPVSATPEWLMVAQPIGIEVSGKPTVRIALPRQGDSYAYIDTLPDRVVLVGLDPASLELLPVGVGRIDRAAREVVSEGDLILERLDVIGISTRVPLQPALADYGAGKITLTVLRSALEAQVE